MEGRKRVEMMTADYERVKAVCDRAAAALTALEQVQGEFRTLMDYYGSAAWTQDVAEDSAHAFDGLSSRAVLAQDTLYDLYSDHRELALAMLELATEMLR